MQILDKTITIDPGWNTGIAVWNGTLDPSCCLIKEPAKNSKIKIETVRLNYMFEKFNSVITDFLKHTELQLAYIEGVELWSMNPRSVASAARGDTFTLAYLIGGYIRILQEKEICVRVVYPRGDKKKGRKMWKGQMSAKMVHSRIFRINGISYPEHIREAVGIGFSVIGEL